ncbi:MAG: hypothetical protein H0V73_07295 [Chloroflexi bacterium]|nr:hypothetical protein [Chloroflexota bacterium]
MTVQPATPSIPMVPTDTGPPRDPDLILARAHLRLGSLSLARTELETLAGRGALDDDAIRDLAEARWRTGDVSGAGEAATAWLEGHADDVLGLVIAAEAQAALGRPAEARRLAGRAMERADGSLDPVFAGMQRSAIWPVESVHDDGGAGVLFDDLHPGPHAVRPLAPSGRMGPHAGRPHDPPHAAQAPHPPLEPGVPDVFGGPSIWGDDANGLDAALDDSLDPTTLFHRARVALDAGEASDAATGLILALRALPGLAPAVLDLLAGRGEPILALVRGDAQRIVGREVEAMRDHATAADGLPADEDRPDGAPTPITMHEPEPPGPSAEPDSNPDSAPTATHPDQEES